VTIEAMLYEVVVMLQMERLGIGTSTSRELNLQMLAILSDQLQDKLVNQCLTE
jgi:hypothetical protein